VFAFPGTVAHDASIENVIFNATQTQIAWNAEQWVRAE
jgi:peptide/nickel transport system substrate-binding protein